jgi:twinkle protein
MPVLHHDEEDEIMQHENELEVDHPAPSSAPDAIKPRPTPPPTSSSSSSQFKPAYRSNYTQNAPKYASHHKHTSSGAVADSSEKTFVSSYYRIDESVFVPYLTRKNLVFRQNEKGQIIIRECPFCHDTKSHPTNLWKLYIYTENGHYFCFRCSSQGSW